MIFNITEKNKKIKTSDIVYYYIPNINKELFLLYIFFRVLISEFWLKIILALVNFQFGNQRGLPY